MFGLYFIRDIEPIALFRIVLWYDQVMWAFLIPMAIQSWFSISTGVKMQKIKFQNKFDSFLFPFLITGSVGLIFVSYSIFVWDVLSIIPADHPQAWANKEIDYQTFSLVMLLGGHINSASILLFLKGEKYFIKKYAIKETILWPKKLKIKL